MIQYDPACAFVCEEFTMRKEARQAPKIGWHGRAEEYLLQPQHSLFWLLVSGFMHPLPPPTGVRSNLTDMADWQTD